MDVREHPEVGPLVASLGAARDELGVHHRTHAQERIIVAVDLGFVLGERLGDLEGEWVPLHLALRSGLEALEMMNDLARVKSLRVVMGVINLQVISRPVALSQPRQALDHAMADGL